VEIPVRAHPVESQSSGRRMRVHVVSEIGENIGQIDKFLIWRDILSRSYRNGCLSHLRI